MTGEIAGELIQATTKRAGLRIRAKLDPRTYVVKKEVTAEPLKRVRIRRASLRGEWTLSANWSVPTARDLGIRKERTVAWRRYVRRAQSFGKNRRDYQRPEAHKVTVVLG